MGIVASEVSRLGDVLAPGVVPPRRGCQPVEDLDAFLRTLPDFGEDAAALRRAVAEDRALRRAAVADTDA